MAGAVPTLADWLRDGPRPTPAEALRAVRDVALGLDALHAAGLVHGQVEPARVELHPDGLARLTGEAAREAGPPRPGDGRRGDLRDLGRLLELTLPARTDAAVGEDALAAEGRAVAAWLIDPSPGGAARASDAARALAKVLGGGVFLPPTSRSAPASSVTPLAPHRIALRLACQGVAVGAVAAVVTAPLGRDLAGVSAAAVGWGAGGAVLTLLEELARGRSGRRTTAALLFGASTPSVALLTGSVAWSAVAHGQLPVAVLGELVASVGGRGGLGGVAWLTGLFFVPGVAFASARLRGGGALVPAAWAGVAAAGVMLAVSVVMHLGSARGADSGVLLGAPLMSFVATAVIAFLAGTGLVIGRALEEWIVRTTARTEDGR